MTPPITNERLTQLVRDFMTGLREHFTNEVGEGEREAAVDRLLAVGAGAVGMALTLLRRGKNDQIASALLAVAVRLWTRKAPRDVADVVPLHATR